MKRYKSTEEFAARHLVQPQSVRARYCRTGSYFGTRPKKLPNGRLLWEVDEPEAGACTPSTLEGAAA